MNFKLLSLKTIISNNKITKKIFSKKCIDLVIIKFKMSIYSYIVENYNVDIQLIEHVTYYR